MDYGNIDLETTPGATDEGPYCNCECHNDFKRTCKECFRYCQNIEQVSCETVETHLDYCEPCRGYASLVDVEPKKNDVLDTKE